MEIFNQKLKKVRNEERRKRRRLIGLLISYKKKHKAQEKQLQRLQKLLKDSRQMNIINFLGTQLEAVTNQLETNSIK